MSNIAPKYESQYTRRSIKEYPVEMCLNWTICRMELLGEEDMEHQVARKQWYWRDIISTSLGREVCVVVSVSFEGVARVIRSCH